MPEKCSKMVNLCQTSARITDATKKEIQHFSNSIEFRNQAMGILNSPAGTGPFYTLSKKDEELFINLLKKSLDEAGKVSDETLRCLHNDLPSHYRNEFVKGIALFISALENKNNESLTRDAMKAQKLLYDFGEWYTRNVKK